MGGGERLRSLQQDIVPLEQPREEDVIGQSLGDKEGGGGVGEGKT